MKLHKFKDSKKKRFAITLAKFSVKVQFGSSYNNIGIQETEDMQS